jgi:hypothetical protein
MLRVGYCSFKNCQKIYVTTVIKTKLGSPGYQCSRQVNRSQIALVILVMLPVHTTGQVFPTACTLSQKVYLKEVGRVALCIRTQPK